MLRAERSRPSGQGRPGPSLGAHPLPLTSDLADLPGPHLLATYFSYFSYPCYAWPLSIMSAPRVSVLSLNSISFPPEIITDSWDGAKIVRRCLVYPSPAFPKDNNFHHYGTASKSEPGLGMTHWPHSDLIGFTGHPPSHGAAVAKHRRGVCVWGGGA